MVCHIFVFDLDLMGGRNNTSAFLIIPILLNLKTLLLETQPLKTLLRKVPYLKLSWQGFIKNNISITAAFILKKKKFPSNDFFEYVVHVILPLYFILYTLILSKHMSQ